jgi:hypothetical protein
VWREVEACHEVSCGGMVGERWCFGVDGREVDFVVVVLRVV